MKVVKAYSLDIRTVQLLERYPHGRKSEVVNEAIRWYVGDEVALSYVNLMKSRDALQKAVYKLETEASRGGVKHHLRELLRCLNPFRRQKRE